MDQRTLSCLGAVKKGRSCSSAYMSFTDYTTVVIDRSGSMSNMGEATRTGVNEFIKDRKNFERKNSNHNSIVSVTTFDTLVEKPIPPTLVENIPEVTYNMIQPRGATALVDAIWSSIEDMEKCSPDGDSNSTRTIVVMTDGFDNSSKITKGVLNTKMQEKMALSNPYNFIFLAANQDAITTAQNFGISPENALSYGATPQHCLSAMKSASCSTQRMQSGDHSGFTQLERQQSI